MGKMCVKQNLPSLCIKLENTWTNRVVTQNGSDLVTIELNVFKMNVTKCDNSLVSIQNDINFENWIKDYTFCTGDGKISGNKSKIIFHFRNENVEVKLI